jgi:CubicO group peptidase (beta-lactamase class C family)
MKARALLLFILIFSLKVFAQSDDRMTKIDSIISAYMTANQMPGLSVGIVKNGKIFLAKGYGTAEIDRKQAVDSLTNFLTCSVTKLFTATAIMQLVEQGKLDIHQKLVYYLPDFKMKDARYHDITIEQMMTHTSGLYWDEYLKHSPNDSTALKKFVYSLDKKVLDFAPGTKFDATKTYSNAAYDILGYLVEKISGETYERYIRNHILRQVGMTNSDFNYRNISAMRRSSPHIIKKKKVSVGGMLEENREHSPSANLYSCSLDLCYWMLHILHIYNSEQYAEGVIQKKSLLDMWTGRQIAPQNKRVSMGLGWFLKEDENLGLYCFHVGNNPGFSATLMIFPKQNFGITLLTNSMYAEQVLWNKIPFDIIGLFANEWKK